MDLKKLIEGLPIEIGRKTVTMGESKPYSYKFSRAEIARNAENNNNPWVARIGWRVILALMDECGEQEKFKEGDWFKCESDDPTEPRNMVMRVESIEGEWLVSGRRKCAVKWCRHVPPPQEPKPDPFSGLAWKDPILSEVAATMNALVIRTCDLRDLSRELKAKLEGN